MTRTISTPSLSDPSQINMMNVNNNFKNVALFQKSVPKMNQQATEMNMQEYNMFNKAVVGPPKSYNGFLKKTMNKRSKVGILPSSLAQNFYTTSNKSYQSQAKNGVIYPRTDEYLLDANPTAYSLIKDKYANGQKNFRAVSTVGITTRGLRGISNPSLLRLPTPGNAVLTNRAGGLAGLKGGVGSGPFDTLKKDILYSNTLTTSSQIFNYLNKMGQGQPSDYSLEAPKINPIALRLSGAIAPIPGNYMLPGTSNAMNDKRRKKNHNMAFYHSQNASNSAQSPIKVAGVMHNVTSGAAITNSMYNKHRVNLMDKSINTPPFPVSNFNYSKPAAYSQSTVYQPFKSAIDSVGTPSYQDMLTARYAENHIQTGFSRDLKKNRQRQGSYAVTAPIYPTTAPYTSLFNNQANYIPLETPDAQHGDRKYGQSSAYAEGGSSFRSRQIKAGQRSLKSGIAKRYHTSTAVRQMKGLPVAPPHPVNVK